MPGCLASFHGSAPTHVLARDARKRTTHRLMQGQNHSKAEEKIITCEAYTWVGKSPKSEAAPGTCLSPNFGEDGNLKGDSCWKPFGTSGPWCDSLFYHLLLVWLWDNYYTSLSFHFFICNIRAMPSTSQDGCVRSVPGSLNNSLHCSHYCYLYFYWNCAG